MTGLVIWYFYRSPQTERMCQDKVSERIGGNTVYTASDFIQPASSLAALLIWTQAAWQTTILAAG